MKISKNTQLLACGAHSKFQKAWRKHFILETLQYIMRIYTYLTLIRRETGILNAYFSATECPIDLKPCCISLSLSLVLRYIKKKFINLDLEGTLEGLLSARVPQNQPRRVNFRVHLRVHEGPWGFPEPWWSTTMTINVFHDVQRV